jgi:hypothetical protein
MASKWGAKNGLPGYDTFRSGLSYQDVFEMLKDNHEDSKRWRYKKRGTILGAWHQVKLELYHRAVEAGLLATPLCGASIREKWTQEYEFATCPECRELGERALTSYWINTR